MKKRKITWDKQALHYFRDSIRYIRQDSPKNADKVKFELHRFRVGYLVKEDEIIIARVRNTNQEPLDY